MKRRTILDCSLGLLWICFVYVYMMLFFCMRLEWLECRHAWNHDIRWYKYLLNDHTIAWGPGEGVSFFKLFAWTKENTSCCPHDLSAPNGAWHVILEIQSRKSPRHHWQRRCPTTLRPVPLSAPGHWRQHSWLPSLRWGGSHYTSH